MQLARRLVVAHPRARDPPQPGRDPRPVRAHDRRGPRALRRARGADRGRPRAPAREVPHRAGRGERARTSASPRPGTIGVFESEGNGRMCTTLPRVLVTVMGIEKVVPAWRDIEVFAPAAAALVDGRADEPVHVVLDRRAPRRRARGVPPRPARQRAHRRALRRDRAPGAALHPLLGLPERVPGLLAHGRPGVRLDLPGADRGDPDAAAARPGRGADAAVGVVAVRRVLRGVPGEDRHPERARAPARAGRPRGRGQGAHGEGGDGHRGARVRLAGAATRRRRSSRASAAGRSPASAAACPGSARGRRRATCRRSRPRASATGGAVATTRR